MKLPVYLIDIGAILYPEDKAYSSDTNPTTKDMNALSEWQRK